ncbi:MAG: STAS domain-containing protein [Planctomycetaceae bacterium]|nr:STAS domain-containing protein [Planctomycetaceae bacterium]
MATDSSVIDLEWHGDALVVVVKGAVESLDWTLIDNAAVIILDPIREMQSPLIVFDLGQVRYFGSVFLALLLKCQKQVKPRGGVMVLCELNDLARDLLHTTALDTLWPIYDTRSEALESIGA